VAELVDALTQIEFPQECLGRFLGQGPNLLCFAAFGWRPHRPIVAKQLRLARRALGEGGRDHHQTIWPEWSVNPAVSLDWGRHLRKQSWTKPRISRKQDG